jgi:hypothetical protein
MRPASMTPRPPQVMVLDSADEAVRTPGADVNKQGMAHQVNGPLHHRSGHMEATTDAAAYQETSTGPEKVG